MNVIDRVLAEAMRIPRGAEVRIHGSAPIAAYNLAMRVVAIIHAAEQHGAGDRLYRLLCDEPPLRREPATEEPTP